MSIIAETREFFLRTFALNTGESRDREVGFPITHKVKRLFYNNNEVTEKYIDVSNRFVEGGVPSASIWAKLLNSIVFKNEINIDEVGIEAINQRIDNVEQGLNDIPITLLNKLTTRVIEMPTPLSSNLKAMFVISTDNTEDKIYLNIIYGNATPAKRIATIDIGTGNIYIDTQLHIKNPIILTEKSV